MKPFYVYILQSEAEPERFYASFSEGLHQRIEAHNAGQCPHPLKYRPWRIRNAVAFTSREKALSFEKYLKSPLGRAFAKKRL